MVDSMLGPNRTLNWHHPIQEWQATRALVRSAIRCLIYKKKHEEWPASLEAVWLDHERADWQNPFTKEAVSYHPPEAGDPLPVISVRVRDRETRYWKGPAPRSSADVQRQ